MSDLFWLTPEQLRRIEPYFPPSQGIPRVDDLRVVSEIIHVIRNGLRCRCRRSQSAWRGCRSLAVANVRPGTTG